MTLYRLLSCTALALLLSVPLAQAATGEQACQPWDEASTHRNIESIQSTAGDGTCLQAYLWPPTSGTARAVVVIVHGVRDHALRYSALAERLSAQGLAVVAQDHRGHGRSGGPRQRLDSLAQLRSDVQLAVQAARTRHPGRPVFLFGHSMGGLVSTSMALTTPDAFKGLVLSGAALQLGPEATAVKRGLVQVLGRIWPGLALQPVDDSLFVTTAAAKQAQITDPLIDHQDLPAVTALMFLQGINEVSARFQHLNVPLLALHGAEDRSTDPEGSRRLVQAAGHTDKRLHLVAGAAHDLLHEPMAPALITEIADWLLEHL